MSELLDCATAEHMLSDLLPGELDEPAQESLGAHLASCESCQQRAIAFYKQDRALSELGSAGRLQQLRQRIHEKLRPSALLAKAATPRRLRTVRLRRTMRRRSSLLIPAAVAASILLVAVLALLNRQGGDAESEALAHLTSFSGNPTVLRGGKTIDARDNLSLRSGDSINLPANATASVQFADQNTRLALDASSSLRLDAFENGHRVYLNSGSLTAEVARQKNGEMFVVRTPLARAEVIGTRFKVSAASAETRLDVTEGRVRLVRANDNSQVEVAAGNYAVARESGQMPALALNAPPAAAKKEQLHQLITQVEQAELKTRATAQKAAVQQAVQKFAAQTFRNARGTMPYRLFSPQTRTDMKYPLVLYLHGAGGAGKDNQKHLADQPWCAGVWALPENQEKHPCFVVAPQSTGGWEGNTHLLALDIVDELKKTQPIDAQRVYVTGISSGGNGAFWCLQARPKEFAAAIPVSGWLPDSKKAATFANVPVWIFHGNADTVIKVGTSKLAYDLLSAAGADVRFYEYDKAPHDIFGPVYSTTGLVEWLFSRSLPK